MRKKYDTQVNNNNKQQQKKTIEDHKQRALSRTKRTRLHKLRFQGMIEHTKFYYYTQHTQYIEYITTGVL